MASPVDPSGVTFRLHVSQHPGHRYVEGIDQNRRALLEIYCAVMLGTPYNDFGMH